MNLLKIEFFIKIEITLMAKFFKFCQFYFWKIGSKKKRLYVLKTFVFEQQFIKYINFIKLLAKKFMQRIFMKRDGFAKKNGLILFYEPVSTYHPCTKNNIYATERFFKIVFNDTT